MAPPRISPRPWGLLAALLAAGIVAEPDAASAGAPELAVVVSASNPATPAVADIPPIFTTTQRTLPGGRSIVPFNMPAQSDDRVLFDRAALGLDPDDAARFWIDRKIRGGAAPPRQVPDAALMLRVVGQLEDAIGYLPADRIDKTVRVVARVRNGKLVSP